MAQRGYIRGPTHYIIGMAIANVWSKWSVSQCLGSYVQTGAMSKPVVARLLDAAESHIEAIVTDLELSRRRLKQALH